MWNPSFNRDPEEVAGEIVAIGGNEAGNFWRGARVRYAGASCQPRSNHRYPEKDHFVYPCNTLTIHALRAATMSSVYLDDSILDRMVLAVEKVRNRLKRTTHTLEAAGIRYAVAGGNAVAAWVATIDAAAVRNTQDVDILLRREDLDAAKAALETAGFVYRHAKGIDMFLDGRRAKARDAVHILFAGEKVRRADLAAAASISETETAESDPTGGFRVVSLEALVRMKLTSYRRKDQVHLLDMIEVGLIDNSWPGRFPAELGERLQQLLDDPDG